MNGTHPLLSPHHVYSSNTPSMHELGESSTSSRSSLLTAELIKGKTLYINYHPILRRNLPAAYTPEQIKELVCDAFKEAQHGQFGTVAVLRGALDKRSDDKSTGIATCVNYGFSPADTVCAERRAISELMVAAKQEGGEKKTIEALVISPKSPFDREVRRYGSCAKCLESIQNEAAANRDTLVIMLLRENLSNQPYIDVAPLSVYLPYKGEGLQASLLRGEGIEKLKREATAGAIHAMSKLDKDKLHAAPEMQAASKATGRLQDCIEERSKKRKLEGNAAPAPRVSAEELMRIAMKEAKAEYENRNVSKRKLSVCAVFLSDNGFKLVPASSINASTRLSMPAETIALHDGERQKSGDLVAIAYFGDDKTPVHQDTLGTLSQYTGRNDIILATIRDGKLHLRTIQDYQPLPYVKENRLHETSLPAGPS